CQMAVGVNISHLQKYPKLYEKVDESVKTAGFRLAAEAVAKTMDSKANDTLDYVVYGIGAPGKGGETLILRLKPELSAPDLSKLPGSVKVKTRAGSEYYDVDHYNPRTRGR